MEKKDRLAKALAYLKMRGLIDSQVDAARKMNAAESTMSSAIGGNEKYLNNKFLKRFNDAFNGIFRMEWLLTGEGMMCCENDLFEKENDQQPDQDHQIALLQQQLKRKDDLLMQKDDLIAMKDNLIAEKERLIQVLLAKSTNIS